MKTDEFVAKIAKEFQISDASQFSLSTKFKDLEDWDSIVGLSIIGMIYNSYKVQISGGDINKSSTINDLYLLILSKV